MKALLILGFLVALSSCGTNSVTVPTGKTGGGGGSTTDDDVTVTKRLNCSATETMDGTGLYNQVYTYSVKYYSDGSVDVYCSLAYAESGQGAYGEVWGEMAQFYGPKNPKASNAECDIPATGNNFGLVWTFADHNSSTTGLFAGSTTPYVVLGNLGGFYFEHEPSLTGPLCVTE